MIDQKHNSVIRRKYFKRHILSPQYKLKARLQRKLGTVLHPTKSK
ncbi:hypothetical protein CSB94_3845 [Pseudomonas aeruginosa]|nr:hypothetical protein CSB94_3845 [Pseudomonas aeruginosa]